jgi:uncharacterized protein (TIGR02118 family)
MTVKLVVLYTQPDDPEQFAAHYRDVHAPLVDAIPGLQRWDHGPVVGAADGGELTYHWTATLYFADPAAMRAGMGSPEGKAAADDFPGFAPAGSRMFVAAVD